MATAGSVRYQVKVETKDVRKATREVRSNLAKQRAQVRATKRAWDSLNTGLEGFAKRITSLRGVLGVALGGGVFGSFVKNAAAAGAELVELSAGVGDTVENVQKLTQAFKSDGIEAGKTIEFFEKLTRAAQEAGRGVKTYTDAFRSIGVTDFGAFARLSATEKAFELQERGTVVSREVLANFLRTTGGRGETATRLTGIFGQEGRVQSLFDGVEGLARVSQEAAENLKELDQAIFNLTNDVVKTFQEAVGDAAPEIIKLTEALRDQTPKLREAIEWIIRNGDNIRDIFLTAVGGGLALRGATGALSAAGTAAALGGGGAKAAQTLGRIAGPVSIVITGAVVLSILGQITRAARDEASRARALGVAEGLTTEELFAEVNQRAGAGISERVSRAYPAAAGFVRGDVAESAGVQAFAEELERRFFEAPRPTQEPIPVKVESVDAPPETPGIPPLGQLGYLRESFSTLTGFAPLPQLGGGQPSQDEIAGLLPGLARVTQRQNIAIRDEQRRREAIRDQEALYRAYEQSSIGTKALIDTAYSAGGAFRSLIRDLQDTSDETRTTSDKIKAFVGSIFDIFAQSFLDRQSGRLSDFLVRTLGFQHGGYTPVGSFIAGETGPELISTRRQLYVHNPQDTRQVLSREDSMGNTNITVNLRIEAIDAEGLDRAGDRISQRVGNDVFRALERDRHVLRG